MSSLWTPEGEHPVEREPTTGDAGETQRKTTSPRPRSPGPGPDLDDELTLEETQQMEQRLEELRNQLVSTPAEVVVANHAYGLFELAAIHLSESPPGLHDARLAIDAMAAVVEGLKGRLGQAETSLQEALAQIRLAFVQIGGAVESSENAKSEEAEAGNQSSS